MTSSISFLGTVNIIRNIYDGDDNKKNQNENISAIEVMDKLLIIGADEGNKVKILKLNGSSYQTVGSGIELDIAKEEIDIEGIARENNTVYVVGSHSWKRKKIDPKKSYQANQETMFSAGAVESEPDRDCLFRFQLDAGGNVSALEETNLRSIIDTNPLLNRFSHIPSKENGVDIEGIAVRDEQLYIGFRGPVLRENWVPILKCKFSKPIAGADLVFINLDGRGVRDITRVSEGFLILAGPMGDGPGSYQAYFWDGEDCLPGTRTSGKVGQIKLLGEIPVYENTKAEGLALLAESTSGNEVHYEVLIVFDGAKNGAPTRLKIIRKS